jgi:soluble lytic murein transglycosylase-like protein
VGAYASGNFRKAIGLSNGRGAGRGSLYYGKTQDYFAYPILPFAGGSSPPFPDPYFIHAIMRQESAFDEAVVSSAGAVGLGQIMPETGRRIARGLGVKKYKKEMLFNPIVNYTFSRAYLKSLILLTGGDLVRVAASYNAGSMAVKRWGKGRGSDPFLFPELIGYEETRMYVRRVFLNYLHYLELYGKGWGRHQLIESGTGKGTL